MDEKHLDELAQRIGAAVVPSRRRNGRGEIDGSITGRDPAKEGELAAEKAIEAFRKIIDQHRKPTVSA